MEQSKRRLEESQDTLIEEVAKLRAQGLDRVIQSRLLSDQHLVSLMTAEVNNFILEAGVCVYVFALRSDA